MLNLFRNPRSSGRGGCQCGLWIELKVGRNRTTPAQDEMIDRLRAYGNRVEVCYGWIAAWDVLLEYMGS